MLVLSRKLGERLHIGDAVIVIHKIQGNRVTLAIEAPKTMEVMRSELLQRKEQKKEVDDATT
jgi:carbon storage regulator